MRNSKELSRFIKEKRLINCFEANEYNYLIDFLDDNPVLIEYIDDFIKANHR